MRGRGPVCQEKACTTLPSSAPTATSRPPTTTACTLTVKILTTCRACHVKADELERWQQMPRTRGIITVAVALNAQCTIGAPPASSTHFPVTWRSPASCRNMPAASVPINKTSRIITANARRPTITEPSQNKATLAACICHNQEHERVQQRRRYRSILGRRCLLLFLLRATALLLGCCSLHGSLALPLLRRHFATPNTSDTSPVLGLPGWEAISSARTEQEAKAHKRTTQTSKHTIPTESVSSKRAQRRIHFQHRQGILNGGSSIPHHTHPTESGPQQQNTGGSQVYRLSEI